MKELEWWIYQSRKVDDPWAIHMTAWKDGRRIRASTEIYGDFFADVPSKRMLIGMRSIVNLDSWLGDVRQILRAYGRELTDADRNQLIEEVSELKKQFKD